MVNEPDIVIGRLKEHTLYNLEAYYLLSTLIDNTNVIYKSHSSGILITPISDHQMYFCTKNENLIDLKTHKICESRIL